jgi:dGTPase
MEWSSLLTDKRLGKNKPEPTTRERTPFHQDYDRVVFSSAFRRLQDKTQVFPLAKSDYVRTRLTHSVEASCVGRSLGIAVGFGLHDRKKLPMDVTASDLGMIVSTACLAHDIGNPPFGHAGEKAIQEWFHSKGRSLIEQLSSDQEQQDFLRFEGNAQGFRILTSLQQPQNAGGLQLTCSTLATFSKYPTASDIAANKNKAPNISTKKHGFLRADSHYFQEVAKEVGLHSINGSSWTRHPLAFLVEAADDICYSIIDLEDGCRRRHVDFETARDFLGQLIGDSSVMKKADELKNRESTLSYLRAKAIGTLVGKVADRFLAIEDQLLKGTVHEELLNQIAAPQREIIAQIKQIDREQVYTASEVIEVEVPGYEALTGLLDAFVTASEGVAAKGNKASLKDSNLLRLVPDQFFDSKRMPHPSLYQRLLSVTDFICGMTDSYAVFLYKQISGISL